ncbi:hypothetical protein [Burkholderia sp. BCC1644]|uniref:hypothetical protein n=1 Tax=Burkholderia sp. BCC1644 TaxID=2676293 RepID=UPI00159061AE|nr:hypothetical protein [Burkholderia sp. BCC1644]
MSQNQPDRDEIKIILIISENRTIITSVLIAIFFTYSIINACRFGAGVIGQDDAIQIIFRAA